MSKTVLITGAAVRLGRAIALSFAHKGWDVAIHYHRSRKSAQELAGMIRRKKCKAYLVQGDLEDEKSIRQIIPSLSRQGVVLDCLINNAAAFTKDNMRTLTHTSWQLHMGVNLFAPLLLMQAFAAQYKGSSGNIINITDGIAGWSVSPDFLSYSLSKQGLTYAAHMLARELAPAIRINTVAPGPTLEGKLDKKDTFAKLRKIIPLKRTSSPEEISDAIHYLLSAPSLTGQIIVLSGGMQTLPFLSS